jgi:cholesterol transport system auxiliary component
MLQTLMLRSLESTNAFGYVGRRPIGPGGDFALLTELVDFQAVEDATDGSATVRLRMIVRLLREDDGRIVATGRFDASAVSPSTETQTIVAAFDAAAKVLMKDFTDWTLSSLGRL